MSPIPLNPTITESRRNQTLRELRHEEPPKVRTSGGKVHYIKKGGRPGGVILGCTGRHIGLGGAIPTDKPVDCATCKRKLSAGTLHEAASQGESKKPASVHTSTVFDDKDPADSYPSGTEINFGETAPMDMGGIPDLFDPSAVTGDGI